MSDGDAFFGWLGGVVMASIVWFMIAGAWYFDGINTGKDLENKAWQQEMIDRGEAHYDAKTAVWEWNHK